MDTISTLILTISPPHLLWSACLVMFLFTEMVTQFGLLIARRINLLYELTMKLRQLLSVGWVEGDQEKTKSFPFYGLLTQCLTSAVYKNNSKRYIPERKVESSISSLVKLLVNSQCVFIYHNNQNAGQQSGPRRSDTNRLTKMEISTLAF